MIDAGEAVRKVALATARLSGMSRLLGRYVGGIGAIMMLHRVSREGRKPLGINRHLTISPDFLDAVLGEMRRLGYAFVSIDEAVEAIVRPGRGRFAAFTADDAYRDNLSDALPVLESHGAPIAIYVAPGLTEGRVALWWDVLEDIVTMRDGFYLPTPRGPVAIDCSTPAAKVEANRLVHDYLTNEVPEEQQLGVLSEIAASSGLDPAEVGRDALMDWDELRAIAVHPLVTIGAHTVHHYNLRRLPEDCALREMADAAKLIELELGFRPRHMAYPYGYRTAVGPREVRLAREAGFTSAVTTRHGVLQRGHAGHLHALPRLSVNGRYQKLAHLRTMLSGVTTPMANAGRRLVTV